MNPITFSTLACPRWQIETVIANASAFGYDGIEWRGGPEGHLQPQSPATKRSNVQQQCSDTGLISLAITAYTNFVSDSTEERKANVDELKRYADLAAEIGASYVRTFLGKLPPGTHIDSSVYQKILDSLHTVCEYAESVGVKIAVEPHDDFVRSVDVVPVFDSHLALRVIWDIGNTFAAGEEPAEGFELLKNHLAYIQVKDGRGRDPHWQLSPLGDGDVPLSQAFALLFANDYCGAFSIEWEYAWHPELDPPETALPAALRSVQKLLAAAAQSEST